MLFPKVARADTLSHFDWQSPYQRFRVTNDNWRAHSHLGGDRCWEFLISDFGCHEILPCWSKLSWWDSSIPLCPPLLHSREYQGPNCNSHTAHSKWVWFLPISPIFCRKCITTIINIACSLKDPRQGKKASAKQATGTPIGYRCRT